MALENIVIATSSNHVFNLEGETGEKHITIKGKSDVSLFFLLHNADIKLIIDVVDEHCCVSCAAVLVSAGNIPANVDFAVALKASHTKADIYALSLLGDNAKAVVNGGVTIDPNIIQAQGYLSEENMLLGKKIQIKTLPMLDIRSNDVKASHGATISRLDEQKIFYLTAKGLPKAVAENLMVKSYIQKALDHAKVEEGEDHINHILGLLEAKKR